MSSLLDLLKQKKAQLAANNRKKTLKIAEGRGRYRILPTWRKEGDQFWHDFGAHYIRKPGDDKPAVYICTDKTFGKPCQVCAAVSAAIKSATNDSTIEALTQAKANPRVLLNALHLDGPGANPNEVHILEIPGTLFAMIVDIVTEWVDAGENPLDVGTGKGKDFIIERTGTGKATKYTVQVAAKATPVPAEVLKRLHDLDAYVAQESAEAEQRALQTVRAAAGLLPAPTGGSGLAASRLTPPAAATTLIEDEYEVAEAPGKKAAGAMKPEVFEDVPEVFEPPKTEAPAVESSGDPELDELLRGLP